MIAEPWKMFRGVGWIGCCIRKTLHNFPFLFSVHISYGKEIFKSNGFFLKVAKSQFFIQAEGFQI